MIEAQAINAARPSDPILDWSGLVEEGRATLAAMSDGRWTDFNAHDPGITILELVAYALTDLGYRAGHPMSDLLAGSAPLLGPAESLTTRAVTVADLRRLGLDVVGVRNVWIEPATVGGVRLRYAGGARDLWLEDVRTERTEDVTLAGVHRVVIEKSSREDLASAEVAREVALRFHAERNLGEDFDSFAVLESQAIVVAADVEIDEPERAEEILLAIYRRLDGYLSPQRELRTVAELRKAGQASDVIYDGPRVEGGVLADAIGGEERRRVLHLSDVIAELASTQGVRATRRVRLGNSIDEALTGPIAWSFPVDAERVPAFDIASSRIRLLRGGAVALDSANRPDLAQRFATETRRASGSDAMREEPRRAGRDRRIVDYHPLRMDLPRTYGVRPGALGREASSARRAAANQLRAYLAIFDALLANLFAQLNGAKSLLSASADDRRSYFAQPAEGPTAETQVLSAGLTDDALQRLVEPAEDPTASARRSRFLAHLLARFAENVPATPQPVGLGFAGDTTAAGDLQLHARKAFLGSFVRVSAGRGSGANLLVDGEESPLVERIRLKLGLPPVAAERVLLVEHILLRGSPDDEPAAQPLLSAAARADPYSLQVSFVLDERLKAVPGDAEAIARVIRDECPAHLIAYVRWLGTDEFNSFAKAYSLWMQALRHHRREQLGLAG